MALEIILYDRSPVVHKIFSHVLYHYAPVIYRTDQVTEFTAKIQSRPPDLVFIDYSISQELDKKLSAEVANAVQSVTVILLSKQDIQGVSIMPYKAKDYLTKPIDGNKLKELIDRFVPKAKNHLLKEHLIFPSMPDFDEDSPSSSGEVGSRFIDNKAQDFLSSPMFSSSTTTSKSIALPKTSPGIEMELDSESELHIPSTKAQFPRVKKEKPKATPAASKAGLNLDESSDGDLLIKQATQQSSSRASLPPKQGASINMATDSKNVQISQNQIEAKTHNSQKPKGKQIDLEDTGESIGEIRQTPSPQNQSHDSPGLQQKNDKEAMPLDNIKIQVVDEPKPGPQDKVDELAIQGRPSNPANQVKAESEPEEPSLAIQGEKVDLQEIKLASAANKTEVSGEADELKLAIQEGPSSPAVSENEVEPEPEPVEPEPVEATPSAEVKPPVAEATPPEAKPEPQNPSKNTNISEESIKQHLKKELEKKIASFLDKEAKQMMQITAERAVWQVVPELAKQLIEKELEKILKESKSKED